MSDWIDANERLPDDESRVLVASLMERSDGKSKYYIVTGWYNVLEERWANDMNVTHWQPLPAPPYWIELED